MHLNQAVDQVRRAETVRLRAAGQASAQQLKHTRWTLLRRGSRVRGRPRQRLNALLASKLETARASALKEVFSHFWKYRSATWARAQGEISTGAVEGLNNKIRVMTRRSYGFRTYEAMKIGLHHTLGRLPEPESTHKYW